MTIELEKSARVHIHVHVSLSMSVSMDTEAWTGTHGQGHLSATVGGELQQHLSLKDYLDVCVQYVTVCSLSILFTILIQRFVPFDVLSFNILSHSTFFTFDIFLPFDILSLLAFFTFDFMSIRPFCPFNIFYHSTFYHSAFCPI